MLGAIIGDIVGSRFEFEDKKSKYNFKLFNDECFYTDDTVMTLAIAKALKESKHDNSKVSELAIKYMQEFGKKHPFCSYGARFETWLYSKFPQPYNSYGNGSAMRVSACGWYGSSEEEVIELAKAVTEVTHNHEEGIKGAVITAMCVYYARNGYKKEFIKDYVILHYDIDFNYDDLVKKYKFNEKCQETVPQAIYCFLISDSFEDSIRKTMCIGGDSDTLGAINGAIAEAYYGIPDKFNRVFDYFLSDDLLKIVKEIKQNN